jgi:tRNA G18 (ribose-2'-O)-methylase SpoU
MRKLKLDELNRLDPEEYRKVEKLPVTIVLDNIRSAFNVGSIFRTCDGLGLSNIILTGITARPPHKEINKAAIGATESVTWEYHQDIVEYISSIKNDNNLIVGVEQTDESVMLSNLNLNLVDKHIYLIMGNEVEGLNENILPLLDHAIEIEQYGTKHSFNVAVCAGMVMWELSKVLRS